MAVHTTPPRSGIFDIVSGILDDVRVLMRQEVQLLRDEVKLEVSKAGRAASGLGIGIGLLAVGGIFLLAMLVHGLHEWFNLPMWLSYAIVGGLLAGAGVVLLMRARTLASNVHAVPRRTLYAIKEDAQWIKEQVISKRT
ncbi:MAG: phage holin family protein [Nitrospiraceae bacterium]|nr:phage holin family protein [Nitrospiraceae bacterium]